MRIRLMKKSDVPQVVELFVESYKKEEKGMRWSKPVAEKYILMIYRMCKELCFVIVNKDKIIACAMSIITPEYDKCIIDSKILLVHPQFRKQGLAKKLIRKTCLKSESKYNIDFIECNIYTLTNFPISWYESIGFRTKKNYEITRAKISKVLKEI